MGILGSFLGTDQRKDLANAKGQSDAALATGYSSAYGDLTDAGNYFAPYSQYGSDQIQHAGQDQQFYEDALGLHGEGAANVATGTMAANPLFQGQLGQDSNAVSRSLNATGQSGGGKAQLAAQRIFQQTSGNWLDRYRGAAQDAQSGVQTGLTATNAMAGYRADRGNLSYGYGATRAGADTQYGNAMAASRSVPIQNIMGVAQLGVNALRPTPQLRTP